MIFAVVMPLAAMADSYTSLWKKYDAARAKDHPKTVLEVLGKISSRIVAEVPGANRVCYDITSKPPATIEWE